LKLHLWQQFSSNHSSCFLVVGTFATPGEAEAAAEELRRLFKDIETWYETVTRSEFDSIERISLPEYQWRAEHGMESEGRSLYDFESFYLRPNAIKVSDRLIFISASDTYQDPSIFASLSAALGGQWMVNSGYEILSSMVADIRCTAANSSEAERIYKVLTTFLNESSHRDAPSWLKSEVLAHKLFPIEAVGVVTLNNLHLRCLVSSSYMDHNLPILIDYLNKKGCTDFQFTCSKELMDHPDLAIREMTPGDLLALDQIDPAFESASYLDVELEEEAGGMTFRLVERAFDTPFVKETGYRYDADELAQTRYRLEDAEDALLLVAEVAGRLVAVLEVEGEAWRNTALIWALFVDKAWRGQGLGTDLLRRAEAWASDGGYRAIVLETQTNNVPALRFYQRHGYQIAGLDTFFYSNEDVEKKEVALFLYKPL
jgi:ribosomal protein S18 acetylase RimI-like enzyme